MSAYVADRTECEGTNFSRPFGDVVSHREELCRLLVKKQMIAAEVWTAHMPVETLGL